MSYTMAGTDIASENAAAQMTVTNMKATSVDIYAKFERLYSEPIAYIFLGY